LKILILKPSSLGDVIQALPVLRLIKSHLPASEVFWWIDAHLAPLLEGDPDLAGVVRFERKRWAAPRHWPEMLHSIHWMREQHFDWVIDLQCLARSGAFAWLASGKLLIGLDEVREGARGFYDVAVRRASFHTHAADWYLAVLPKLGVPVHKNFQWLPERPAVAAEVKRKWPGEAQKGKDEGREPVRTPILRSEAAEGRPDSHPSLRSYGGQAALRTAHWIALQPGARWENKRWPAGHYAELIRRMAGKFPDARFAILGAAEDRPLGEIIARAQPQRCLNLCGQTSLPEMVEWLRRCDLLVTNDTGPMHAAAALGRPLVAIFGPTEPRRTGPYGHLESVLRIDLPCSPCLKSHCTYEKPDECLKAISPETVFERACRLLTPA